MWELIQQNKRRSFWIFILMGVLLIALGYAIGAAWAPPDGGALGAVGAIIIWIILAAIAWFSGDSIMLNSVGAKEVSPEVHPQLFNVVEEMKIAAQLPKMPKVYIIDSPAQNAFATGRKPENAAIAVTAGLLGRMNRDELQGVVAHETGHILNRDILFVTFAGVMLGAVVIISEVFLRSLWYGGGRGRRVGSRDKGSQGAAVIAIVAIAFAILAPILARLLYFALSRRREYLADATAARLTRYPEGLASALEKLSQSTEDLPRISKATAPMFIVNPLKQAGAKLANLTSTHPPIDERIRILRSMAGGAGFLEYQRAYESVSGDKSALVPKSGLVDATAIPIRSGSPTEAKPVASDRQVNDLVRAVNGFVFMSCSCGLKMKIRPDFNSNQITCPRCQTVNAIPTADLATASAALESVANVSNPAQLPSFQRRSNSWESFRCQCGRPIQLSPSFSGAQVKCSSCGRTTLIKSLQ